MADDTTHSHEFRDKVEMVLQTLKMQELAVRLGVGNVQHLMEQMAEYREREQVDLCPYDAIIVSRVSQAYRMMAEIIDLVDKRGRYRLLTPDPVREPAEWESN